MLQLRINLDYIKKLNSKCQNREIMKLKFKYLFQINSIDYVFVIRIFCFPLFPACF